MKLSPLDKTCSEFARKRAMHKTGGCERCLRPKYDITRNDGSIFPDWMQLQCAHLTGRWRKSTRYDEDNLVGICGGCHRVIDRDHTEKEDFILRHLGQEGYDLLKARARTPARYLDENLISIYLKEQIKKLEAYNE